MKGHPAHFCYALLLFLLSFMLSDSCLAQYRVTKKVSISAFGMNWKNSEDAKVHLLSLAKREAVSELFGEFIRSSSEVKDAVLTRDEIQSTGAGFVRISGNPIFSNEEAFGEVSVEINAYVTEKDLIRFQPREVYKKVCIADPRLSLGEIRQTAERQARLQAVKDFEPKLEQVDDETVLALIHEAEIKDAGFIPDTTTYCATAVGKIYPIELTTASRRSSIPKVSINQARGSVVTASAIYSSGAETFPADRAVDGSTDESCYTCRSFWLLPNRTTGSLKVQLNSPATIRKIRFLNTHNRQYNDRATLDYHIDVITAKGALTVQRGRLDYSPNPQWNETTFQPIRAQAVVFHVDSYYHAGGGLNEIEIY